MKKIMSIMLTLCLSLSLASPAAAAFGADSPRFLDVPMNHWAFPYIQKAAENEWVAGVGDGKFDPNGKVTGAQFTTMVVRAFYEKYIDQSAESSYWYEPYQIVANKQSLLTDQAVGINLNSTMDKPLTRTEMAFILSRVIGNQGLNPSKDKIETTKNKIPDLKSIDEDFRNGVAISYCLGLLSGTDDKGTFDGNSNMNRAQAAVVLCRLDEVIKNGGAVDQPNQPEEPSKPVDPVEPNEPVETPDGNYGPVGTISDTPVKLSYSTHKPVTDYWSKAPADIQAITDKDAFNAAVQTLKDQEMIRNAPENKGGWSPYYNYAAFVLTGDASTPFDQKQLNVTKAMGIMSSNTYGIGSKDRLKNADNNKLCVFVSAAGDNVVDICQDIVNKISAGNDKELAEQLVQEIADHFSYGSGSFDWDGGTTGDCDDYENATGSLFAVAGIPYIHSGGDSNSGPHDWGYAYLDGNWYAVDSTYYDGTTDINYAHMDIDQYHASEGCGPLRDSERVAMALVEAAQ